ncbi:hypothetical protein [Methylobacterium sp. Leaf94]|uniref:hypothetical protein n=1 Tax=Methylobacterium sp. Leaf94 TaxID=1736250 RepID=UPI000A7A3543|nr:hypothetical protein [Methylobacterium sp. Leaf94]
MDIFNRLEDEGFFQEFIRNHFENVPGQVITDFGCTNKVDAERIKYAYIEYMQSIKGYTVLLHSENPDHYKRAGALMQALYKSKIITEVEFTDSDYGDLDAVEADHVLGLSYDDAQDMTRLPRFYREYHNQLLSFDIAYLCCASYEDEPRGFDINYLHNMCFYLWRNEDLSVDSCAMIFRSLFH